MLQFAECVAKSGGTGFTGHLSFDLLRTKKSQTEENTSKNEEPELYSIECNPRVHTTIVLF